MYSAYVLYNPQGRLYIGSTSDIEKRVLQHQQGEGDWTKSRGPWEAAFAEVYSTMAEAMKREKFLKSGKGRSFIKNKLKGRAGPPQAD